MAISHLKLAEQQLISRYSAPINIGQNTINRIRGTLKLGGIMNKLIRLKEAKKQYAQLGFSIRKAKGYYCAERKDSNLHIQSHRLDLLCKTLFRLS